MKTVPTCTVQKSRMLNIGQIFLGVESSSDRSSNDLPIMLSDAVSCAVSVKFDAKLSEVFPTMIRHLKKSAHSNKIRHNPSYIH